MFELTFNFWSFLGGMALGGVGLLVVCFILAWNEDRKYWYDDYPSYED